MDYQRNFMDSLAGGLQFGQQVKQQRDQNQLRGLASLAQGAPVEQRQSLLSQMAGINPEYAQAQKKAWSADDEADREELVRMARYIKQAPPEQQPAAYASILPKLRERGMQAPEWGPDSQDMILKTVNALASSFGDESANNPYSGLPADIQSLKMLQSDPALAALDKERRQYSGMVPKLVETSQGMGWGTPGSGIKLAPLEGVAGSAPAQQVEAPQLFAALGQKYGIQPTSVLRSPERNEAVGGKPNSYHLSGRAADFVVPQAQKAQFMQDARANGYEAIDEGDHIHIEPAGRGGGGAPNIAQPFQKPQAPSELDRRIEAARAMGASEDEIRRMIIGRDGAAAGAKPLPPQAMKEILAAEEAMAAAQNVSTMIKKHSQRMADGSLVVGPVDSIGAQFRTRLGMSNANDVNLNEYRADLTKIVNESLRLNSGVQTEGDAQRAANELMDANDPATAARALRRLQEYNTRAIELQKRKMDLVRRNYGQDASGQPAQQRAPAQSGGVDDLLSKYGAN